MESYVYAELMCGIIDQALMDPDARSMFGAAEQIIILKGAARVLGIGIGIIEEESCERTYFCAEVDLGTVGDLVTFRRIAQAVLNHHVLIR